MFYTLKKKIYTYIDKTFLDGCTNYNSLDVRRRSRTKFQSRDMFEKNNLPHAKGTVFFNPFRAFSFVKKYGFPVVLKPNVGGYSRGSFFPIRNNKELIKALFLVKLYWPKTVIEQFLEGKNYRVTVFDKKIIAVAQRFAPHVIGDGTKTINTLIDEENATRDKMNLYPVMHPIKKDKKTIKHLKKNEHTLTSIPKKNELVTTFHRIALTPGGIIENIEIDSLSTKNTEMFQKVLTLFNARVFGIDIIMEEGVEIDYDKQKCILLEVNSRPYMKLHQYPRFGNIPDMSAYYKKLDTLTIKDAEIF